MSQCLRWHDAHGSSISICETHRAGVEDARIRAASAAWIRGIRIGRVRHSRRGFCATQRDLASGMKSIGSGLARAANKARMLSARRDLGAICRIWARFVAHLA